MDWLNKKIGRKIAYSSSEYEDVPKIPTGLSPLDDILGGGLPRGRMTEVYGLQGTGKTTLMMQVIANNPDLRVVWVDAESAWQKDYAQGLGVGNITILRPSHGEEAIDAIEEILLNNAADLIVVDSIPSLVPKAEREAKSDQQFMGGQARLLSRAMRKFLIPVQESSTSMVFINQMRVNIMGGQYDPYTRPGGMSFKHYTSLQIELKRLKALKQSEDVVGYEVRARTIKSRIAPPFQTTTMHLIFGEGFSAEVSLLEEAIDKGVIERKGRSYSFRGERFATSKKEAMENIKDIAEEVEKDLR